MKFRSIVAAAGSAAILLGLSACSSAGTTTCSQYAALSNQDRQSVQRTLLREHDLEDRTSTSNLIGVSEAIDKFCGVNSLFASGTQAAATRNAAAQIDSAVNWNSPTW